MLYCLLDPLLGLRRDIIIFIQYPGDSCDRNIAVNGNIPDSYFFACFHNFTSYLTLFLLLILIYIFCQDIVNKKTLFLRKRLPGQKMKHIRQ